MRPFGFLMCLGKALVTNLGAAVGLGWVGLAWNVSQDVWDEWQKQKNEHERRAELQSLVNLALDDFRKQAVEVVREVAGDLPPNDKERVADGLMEAVNALRQSFKQAEESSTAVSVSSSKDLATLLTAGVNSPVPRVALVQVDGPLKGREFVFDGVASAIVGRESGCNPVFPKDQAHKTISRHHCMLDINPPDVRVRDLGSRCGTFVNDELIGQRAKDQAREDAKSLQLPERNLRDGDILRLCKKGTAAFEVRITVPLVCAMCGTVLAPDSKGKDAAKAQCEDCRRNATISQPRRACAQCGQDVADEPGAQRQGEYVCASCRDKLSCQAPGAEAPKVQGYAMLRTLGRGGMGAVWLARKESTKQLSAVKVMLPSVAANQRSVKRFLQEMNVMRSLEHPHLVRLLEAGYQRGTFFLSLDYCDGGSVASLMKLRGGTLPVDEAMEITLQALDGLRYAHNLFGPGKGLVHRDIKPVNLFLSGAGSSRLAKVGDYGLAKAFDDTGLGGLTRTGETAGTPHFMPRQQVHQFKNPTPDFDVWAMAASLYNMLTGRFPRAFPKGVDKWLAVLEGNPVPIRRRLPNFPAKLAGVIDHALTEQPAIGFKTAAEFKAALEDAI